MRTEDTVGRRSSQLRAICGTALPVSGAPCVRQAVDRGGAPEGTDAHEVVRAVSAPLYYHLHISDGQLDEATAVRAAEAAAATRAGVHAPDGGRRP
ncbi:TetR/AcrR family transcriptional regulator C-terminal ligand-binding domain-containing protein [Streptomyces sp. NPDC002486]